MNQNQPSGLHNSQLSKVRRLDKNFGHELLVKTNTTQPSFSKVSMEKSHDEHQRPEEAPSLSVTDAAESAVSLFVLRTLGIWPSDMPFETQLSHLYHAFEDDFKL